MVKTRLKCPSKATRCLDAKFRRSHELHRNFLYLSFLGSSCQILHLGHFIFSCLPFQCRTSGGLFQHFHQPLSRIHQLYFSVSVKFILGCYPSDPHFIPFITPPPPHILPYFETYLIIYLSRPMAEKVSNGNAHSSTPLPNQDIPSPLETLIYLDEDGSKSTQPATKFMNEKHFASYREADGGHRTEVIGKVKLGATTSLPFMGESDLPIPTLRWNPSASSDFLPKHHFNANFRSHDQGRSIHPYGQLEHPSRNGTSSMPHMAYSNGSRENISIVSPPHYVEGRDIGCPYPTRSYALDVLHGVPPAGKMVFSSINLDQFGLPIWPSSAIMEQEAEIAALIQYLEPTIFEQEQQLLLFNAISDITNDIFKNSRLVRFGSTVNGFSLRGADVDFCLFVGSLDDDTTMDGEERNSSNIAESVLTRLGAALMSHGRFIQIKVLTRARVPIIKLKDSVTGISCDIGVNNSLALHNTRLLFLYGQYDSKGSIASPHHKNGGQGNVP